MPVYLCGCDEGGAVTDITETVRLAYCDGVLVHCPVPLPIALPGGPIFTNLAGLPGFVEETREDIDVAWNADGCRLDVTRRSNTAPVGEVEMWPVIVAPIVDHGAGNAPLCPFPSRVVWPTGAGGPGYTSLAALADAVEASFPAGTVAAATGIDGCSIVIAHECRLDIPAVIAVDLPAPSITTTVDVINQVSGAVFNPIPFPVAFANQRVNDINELAVAFEDWLPSGYTVVPHANGRQLTVTRPSDATPPPAAAVTTTMVTRYPIRDTRRGVDMCPPLFPATADSRYLAAGLLFNNLAELVATLSAGIPPGWTHAVSADGCASELTHPVSGAPALDPQYIGVIPRLIAYRADSQLTGVAYGNLLSEPATTSDPVDFDRFIFAPKDVTVPPSPAGSNPVYASAWISDFPTGIGGWTAGDTILRFDFDVLAFPSTVLHPVHGTVGTQPMAVGLRHTAGGTSTLRPVTITRISGSGFMQGSDTANQPYPHARIASTGRFRVEFNIAGLSPGDLRLGFVVMPPGTRLANPEIDFL